MTVDGYTAEEIRNAEAPLLAAGVPLMARAAEGLAREIAGLLPPARGRVVILVGSGDNGGDALFAGAHLADDGTEVTIVPTGARMHEAGLAAALAAGAVVLPESDRVDPADGGESRLAALVRSADVVVDGIVGIGGTGDPALRGTARDVVLAILPILTSGRPPLVVAVDLPSGVQSDTGAVTDPTVLRADVTVTFGGVKRGLLRQPGAGYAGEVRLIDIGLDLAGSPAEG